MTPDFLLGAAAGLTVAAIVVLLAWKSRFAAFSETSEQ